MDLTILANFSQMRQSEINLAKLDLYKAFGDVSPASIVTATL